MELKRRMNRALWLCIWSVLAFFCSRGERAIAYAGTPPVVEAVKGKEPAPAADEKGDKAAAADEKGGKEAKEDSGEKEEKVAKVPRTEPVRVTVGVYINDIQNIDLRTHTYALDLYVWFRWKGDDIDPSETVEFVNAFEQWGLSKSPNFKEPELMPNGERYQAVRFEGKFSKKFPLYNYPFDRQTLYVALEDQTYDSKDLVYVADTNPITMSPQVLLPGFNIGQAKFSIYDYMYPTNFGDIRPVNTFSRVEVSIPLSRPVFAYSLKLLLPVLCATACAALMFLIPANYVDSRVTVGITSLLTIVALQMSFNDDLPEVAYLTLMDKLYVCAYLFVITGLGIIVATAGMIAQGRVQDAVRLHRQSLIGLLSVYGLATSMLVARAIPT